MNTSDTAVIDPTFARALYYRFLARAFSYPKAGTLQALQDDLPPAETAAVWGSDAVRPALEDVARRLAEQTDASLESAHLAVFGHTISDKWPPHETRFGSSHPFQETQDMADVAAFYEAFGLKVKTGTGERVDHIALELEFGHFLAVKELVARERSDAEGEAVTRDASKKFFKDHIGRWGPVFGEILAQKTSVPWTQSLGTLLAAVLRADCGVLGVTPGVVSSEPIPLPPEPVAEDEGEGEE